MVNAIPTRESGKKKTTGKTLGSHNLLHRVLGLAVGGEGDVDGRALALAADVLAGVIATRHDRRREVQRLLVRRGLLVDADRHLRIGDRLRHKAVRTGRGGVAVHPQRSVRARAP